MILKQLKLRDFGVFRGDSNIVDLQPRVKYGRKRPIILFGGLNGAGKTTTLTAIRLALYGKQSLGKAVSAASYQQFLSECIHKPKSNEFPPYSASVELEFSYGRQGILSDYKIDRSWSLRNDKITENVEIHQDGELLKGLSEEQKQSFLNELIPIGVADLFFFDGEKISALAEDDGNIALSDAINRLLGLDIIGRLGADLSIYLRDQKKGKLPSDIAKEIDSLENEYQSEYLAYQKKLTEVSELKTKATYLDKDAEKLKSNINDLGGAWALSRQEEERKVDVLRLEKESLTNQIKDLISGSATLGLARNQLTKLVKQLKEEEIINEHHILSNNLKKRTEKLRKRIEKEIGKEHASTITDIINKELIDKPPRGNILHDVSSSEFTRILYMLEKEAPEKQKALERLSSRLDQINDEIDISGINISRAPDEKRIAGLVEELSSIEKSIGESREKITSATKDAKSSLGKAIEILRKLREKEAEYSNNLGSNQAITLADKTKNLLESFAEETKKSRIETLEQEFIKSFAKLARKEDMNLTAKISLDDYSVTMFDIAGNKIDKKKLSAGEKQIYAIAMLEALGRTSGRNLPIIIDTPLGRLDSKHRSNLVHNYFPTASHQVLVLSTDTEIDEEFYKELSPEISHAFSVDYCSKNGFSTYNEGYFWRN